MHHVGGGVRAGDGAAAVQVDRGVDLGAHDQRALGQAALVHDQVLDRLLHVIDLKHRAVVGQDLALVGQLAASLRVERRTVEDHLDGGRGGDRRHGALALLHDAEDLRTAGVVGVSEEVDRRGQRLLEVVVHGQVHVVALLQRIGAGAGLLLGHQLAELRLVDLHALFGRHLQRQFDREAVGVVQGEGVGAGDGVLAGIPGLGNGHVEDLGAGFQGAAEGVLLTVRGLGHVMEGLLQLGVARHHRVLGHREQRRQHRIGHAERAHRLDDAAQQAAQHVAAAVVGRAHAVAHDHQRGTHVVGDHAELDVHRLVVAVQAAGHALRGLDDREHLVGLIDVVLALQQIGHALQAGAGIDVLVLQLADDVQVGLGLDVVDLEVLEHQVPDLDVAVLVGDRATLDAELGAAVHVDLGAGAAGAGAAGGPEVVLHAHDLDMLGVHALVAPHGAGLLVIGERGHPQLLGVEAVAALVLGLGQQLVGVVDGLFLEVVAEREVAEHLEERAVAGGLAHLVDVQRAHALLVRGHARMGGRLLAHQVRDERHHAGDGEQGGRVRRDQGRRRHDEVVVLFEVIQKALRDFRSAHGWLPLLDIRAWAYQALKQYR